MPVMTQDLLSNAFDLSFEQTLTRSSVHKKSLENVFLTEVRAYGDDCYICGARVPRLHRFFNDSKRPPDLDILFYTEVGRQASVAISHAFLDAGHDRAFIFEQSEAELTDILWDSDRAASSGSAIAVEVKLLEKEKRKNGEIIRVLAKYTMYGEEGVVFRGSGSWSLQPRSVLERLRRRAPRIAPLPNEGSWPEPFLPASYVGRELADNVLISEPSPAADGCAFTARLRVDLGHPFFFDHPCDHVPGMLLLESCAQMAGAVSAAVRGRGSEGALVRAYNVHFLQFVECDLPTTLLANVAPADQGDVAPAQPTVTVGISQNNVLAGTASMRVTFRKRRCCQE
jgi:2-oxo-3-(phosphooxy)propyl 3-oxoalkanoate synthase